MTGMTLRRRLQSLAARLASTTALLVAAILIAVVSVWVTSQRGVIRASTEREARALATSLATSWSNELIDENWNQIRTMLVVLFEQNPEVVYVLVTDRRQHGRIIAAAPEETLDHYVPDFVRVETTQTANEDTHAPRAVETFLLRDVEAYGTLRGRKGERIIEVAADVRAFTRTQSFGVLRVGLSMRRLDRALETVVRDVTLVALVLFGLGIVGGILVARRISTPVRSLERSASRMAGGDLTHRADVQRTDEIGALAGTFNHMAGTLEESFGKLEATLVSFERFVPRKFLSVVAPEGIEHIRVGERATRTITILFSDIRGYTSLSEQTTAEEMFELLNDYLARMGAEIDERGGFIDKYIGDAIMALFDDEHPDDALLAALAMRESLAAWNVERVARGQPRVDTGIGLHRGEVIMGTVGYKSRIDSTVIGDAVNLASRVEGLTKNYDCAVLVTEDIVTALRDRARFVLRVVDEAAKVKGKDVAVRLYAVDGVADSPGDG